MTLLVLENIGFEKCQLIKIKTFFFHLFMTLIAFIINSVCITIFMKTH